MFNRIALIILSIVSVLWIAFVSYNLVFESKKIELSSAFDDSDKQIIVLNSVTKELAFAEEEHIRDNKNWAHVDKIRGERFIKRIFFSSTNKRILIEGVYQFSVNDVRDILQHAGYTIVKKDKGTYTLNNEQMAIHRLDHILIYNGERSSDKLVDLPSYDINSDYSIIHLSKPYRATDVYFKEEGKISYQSSIEKDIHSKKVDDRELFSDYIPIQASNYHFIEREMAQFRHILTSKSPLYQWMDYGMVRFNYGSETVYISDYKESQDPILVLNEYVDKEDTSSADKHHYKGITLAVNLPANEARGFYIYKLGDKVILANSEAVIKQILADHLLGKTLALHPNKAASIYAGLPQKVGERVVKNSTRYTTSIYGKTAIKSVYKSTAAPAEKVDDKPVIAEESTSSWTYNLEGSIRDAHSHKGVLFLLTDTKLSAFGKQRLLWSINLEGTVKGGIQIQDVLADYPILLTSNKGVYLLNMGGALLNGQVLKPEQEFIAPANTYLYKNTVRILTVENNRLVQYETNFKKINHLRVDAHESNVPVFAFKQNKRYVAVVQNNQRSGSYDLDRMRSIKSYSASIPAGSIYQQAETPYFIGVSNKALIRYDYNAQAIKLGNFEDPKYFKSLSNQGFAFASYGKIHVFNKQGVKILQIDSPVQELADFDILTMSNGKVYLALVDGIDNDVFLLDSKGNKVLSKGLEGRNFVRLQEVNGKLVLTTLGDQFIVQYTDLI